MQIIKNTCVVEEIIKKSRFIGIIIPCNNEEAVFNYLKQLHVDYATAHHIAWAYRLKSDNSLIYRFHDAGEPTGTAGKPIFQHLEGKDIINVLLAVIRYFGGIKLGAGGLTRAYSNTAKLAIDTSELYPYIEYSIVSFILDYNRLQAFEYLLKQLEGEILKQDFSAQVQITVSLPKQYLQELVNAFPFHH